ncbi:MAG TPA: MFS transporter [Acidimicrobiales bacterium]|nr:MFS transporter [Acidimicrobiales bacterium]
MTSTARRLVVARAIRGFADGLVSVLLAGYLSRRGFSPFQVGAIVTSTLIGSAGLTLVVGLLGDRLRVRPILLGAAALMVATGTGFFVATRFWPIVLIAAVGTLNPSGGDVSVFLPTEQSVLAGEVSEERRPHLYAFYNLAGTLAAAFGALASALPVLLHERRGWDLLHAEQLGFVVYAALAVAVGVVYRGLPGASTDVALSDGEEAAKRRRPLEQSRRIVLELAALFSLDSAGSGFAVQSMLVLWLHLRFELSASHTAEVFFAASVLAATSQLLAGPMARRIGLVQTMVVTHIPANVFLVLSAFAPSATVAIPLLLVRALLSQMDVPARQSFVMAVVPPNERAAAASVTNVPRSLASAVTPLIAGFLLTKSVFGWPLIIAGTVKITYDLLLLVLYRAVPAEVGAQRARR